MQLADNPPLAPNCSLVAGMQMRAEDGHASGRKMGRAQLLVECGLAIGTKISRTPNFVLRVKLQPG
jgi:hypothetical protein